MSTFVHMTALCLAASSAALGTEISCPGQYGGHLQGIATDPDRNIYRSFTVTLVKTTSEGEILASEEVSSHHGDLTWADGKLYVAVNLGKFNEEAGQADSWVYVYDASDLSLVTRHETQELVHGAGGIGHRDGSFYVVGGLPESHSKNYVYEYDSSFRFVKGHIIESGNTNMGIQTACYTDGVWWFGCYEDEKGLLQTNAEFELLGRHDQDFSYGIARWAEGTYLRGISERDSGRGKWTGKVIVDQLKSFR